MADDEVKKKFSINKIYVKDVSFESPHSPAVFASEADWKPKTKINLNWSSSRVGQTIFEAVLTVTVTATAEDKTAFLIEVQQAGLFTFEGFANEELEPLLGGYCPTVLFPFAREAVSSLVTKGGFPGLMLKHVDFDILYEQKKQQIQAEAVAEDSDSTA